MVLIVSREEADDVLGRLRGLGETAYLIGEVVAGKDGQEQVVID
jgi:phosphoribosylaminoimidazole (AIR) synthetase